MIELSITQGEREWVEARLGIPTASEFNRLVTAGGKASSAAAVDNFLHELLAEWWEGEPQSEWQGNAWTERGHALEGEAYDWYAFTTGERPRKTGIVYRDESRMAACSPDGLINGEGGLELKCPAPTTHIGYLMAAQAGQPPAQYRVQIQGSLWVTGRAWWDFMSYCPGLPAVLVRVEPEEKYQSAMDSVIPAFIDRITAARESLREMGVEFEMDQQEAA